MSDQWSSPPVATAGARFGEADQYVTVPVSILSDACRHSQNAESPAVLIEGTGDGVRVLYAVKSSTPAMKMFRAVKSVDVPGQTLPTDVHWWIPSDLLVSVIADLAEDAAVTLSVHRNKTGYGNTGEVEVESDRLKVPIPLCPCARITTRQASIISRLAEAQVTQRIMLCRGEAGERAYARIDYGQHQSAFVDIEQAPSTGVEIPFGSMCLHAMEAAAGIAGDPAVMEAVEIQPGQVGFLVTRGDGTVSMYSHWHPGHVDRNTGDTTLPGKTSPIADVTVSRSDLHKVLKDVKRVQRSFANRVEGLFDAPVSVGFTKDQVEVRVPARRHLRFAGISGAVAAVQTPRDDESRDLLTLHSGGQFDLNDLNEAANLAEVMGVRSVRMRLVRTSRWSGNQNGQLILLSRAYDGFEIVISPVQQNEPDQRANPNPPDIF